MLTNQYGFSPNAVTITQVVANLGAMTGGTVIGYLSQMFGRRLSIIFASVVGGALIYPYGFIGNERVIAPAFFEQAMVQGVRKYGHRNFAHSLIASQYVQVSVRTLPLRSTAITPNEYKDLLTTL
jgi:MFS family permease